MMYEVYRLIDLLNTSDTNVIMGDFKMIFLRF